MEKRTGTAIIYVENREIAPQVNAVLSRHTYIINFGKPDFYSAAA